jgi:hypothetical protein
MAGQIPAVLVMVRVVAAVLEQLEEVAYCLSLATVVLELQAL